VARLRMVLVLACVLTLAAFAAAQVPLNMTVHPGEGIGTASLGMTEADLVRTFGKPEYRSDDQGVLLEWGVLPNTGDPPDALLWALLDEDETIRVGTDVDRFRTVEGVKVGSKHDDMMQVYGREAIVDPPFIVYPQRGIGFAVVNANVISMFVFPTED